MWKYIWILFYVTVSISMPEFGEFDAKVASYEECKGPKRYNCSKCTSTIENDIVLKLDCDVSQGMPTIKGKVVGMLNKKELVKLQLKNVCDHMFFKPLFQVMFKQPERCSVPKGRFAITVNIQELSYKFYGGKFIYGNWTFSSVFYNENCNLHCSHFILIMSPKKLSPSS